MKKSSIYNEIVDHINEDCGYLARLAGGEEDTRLMPSDFYDGRIQGYLSVLLMLNKN